MRKKLVNKDKFQFRKEDILPPRRGVSTLRNPFSLGWLGRLVVRGEKSSQILWKVNCGDHEQGFESPNSHSVALKKDLTEAVLANQVDYVSAVCKKGENWSVGDASSPPTMQNSRERIHDPFLDEIVAKLKSGLQLGNYSNNKGGGMAREKVISRQNNLAGQTFKTIHPILPSMEYGEGCMCA